MDTAPETSPSGMTESAAVMKLLGADPWMRFDLWANRAWEMAERAIEIAVGIGPSVSADDSLDHRVGALFHAAEVAKEFAEILNPLFAISGDASGGSDMSVQPEMMIDMTCPHEDLD